MRLFAAVDLDAETRDAVAREQKRIAHSITEGRSLRWVQPAHMHLTIVFIGEVAVELVARVTAALALDLPGQPFTVSFERLGAFPPRGAPRTLWLGVKEGAHRLMDVQRAIAERLAGVGLKADERPFHPHLTLARWRSSHPSARRMVDQLECGRTVATLRVDHVTLYRSQLLPAGPAYTALARANLT